MTMRHPGKSGSGTAPTRTPSTKTPLALPRSLMVADPGRMVSSACRRDARASSTTTWHVLPRPTRY